MLIGGEAAGLQQHGGVADGELGDEEAQQRESNRQRALQHVAFDEPDQEPGEGHGADEAAQ